MKLRFIAEAGLKGSRTAIRDAGMALGDLIQFINEFGVDSAEHKALETYLRNPTPRGWDQTRWIIDAATNKALQTNNPETQARTQHWLNLKELTSPVAVAALYDANPTQLKGTPLQRLGMSQPLRDKMKLAMGPQGYVGTFANAGTLPTSRLKELMRTTAKNGSALAKASKSDLPAARPTPRF